MNRFLVHFVLLLIVGFPQLAHSANDSLTADEEVAGSFHYTGYYSTSVGITYSFFCEKNAFIWPKYDELPVSFRREALKYCDSSSNKNGSQVVFGELGNARFDVRGNEEVQLFDPNFYSLGEALEIQKTLPEQPTVYFVFSVLENLQPIGLTKKAVTELIEKGYRVFMVKGFTKEQLAEAVGEDSTYGVLLDAHGSDSLVNLGIWQAGGGFWIDSEGSFVFPEDFTRVSTNLQFFSSLACYGEYKFEAYQKALNLTAEQFHYIPGLHSKNVIDYYFRDSVDGDYDPTSIRIGGEFDPARDEKIANKIKTMNFNKLLDQM